MSLRIHAATVLPSSQSDFRDGSAKDAETIRTVIMRLAGHPPLPAPDDAEGRLKFIAQAHLVVAQITWPCTHVGLEIGVAGQLGIPVLFIAHGRPSYMPSNPLLPQFQHFPLHAAYARDVPPIILGEDDLVRHELPSRIQDPALLEIVRAATEKRQRSRLSTQGIPEM